MAGRGISLFDTRVFVPTRRLGRILLMGLCQKEALIVLLMLMLLKLNLMVESESEKRSSKRDALDEDDRKLLSRILEFSYIGCREEIFLNEGVESFFLTSSF